MKCSNSLVQVALQASVVFFSLYSRHVSEALARVAYFLRFSRLLMKMRKRAGEGRGVLTCAYQRKTACGKFSLYTAIESAYQAGGTYAMRELAEPPVCDNTGLGSPSGDAEFDELAAKERLETSRVAISADDPAELVSAAVHESVSLHMEVRAGH